MKTQDFQFLITFLSFHRSMLVSVIPFQKAIKGILAFLYRIPPQVTLS